MRRLKFAVLVIGLALLITACPSTGGKVPVPEALPAPTGLTAAAADGAVILNWNAASDEGISSYNIHQGTASGSLTKIGSVAAGVLTYTADGLTNGTEYFFAVDAEASDGKVSAKSNEVSAMPFAAGIATPSVVTITPADGATGVGIDSNINVTFSRAMNRAATEAAFTVDPDAACAFSWNAASTRLTCDPASDLNQDTRYTVTVSVDAEDQAGTTLAASRNSTFTTGSTTAATCVFDTSAFADGCVFAP